jgi:ABC-type lipoprotein export system ATPase subunit
VKVLAGVDLQVESGETVAIIGPSGSGKSSLLNIIGTLDVPSAGQVLLEGRDLSGLRDQELAVLRNRTIGFIFQSHHLLPHLTMLENVLIPTLACKSNPAEARGRAMKLLDRVGLSERWSHRPGQLSGGECQRVAVVRALINQPKLLLADEPTGALDHTSAEALAQLLLDLNGEEKVALVVVTHWREFAKRMGRVYELQNGKLHKI